MPRYNVSYTGRYDFEVTADSEWEAEEQAKEMNEHSWQAVEIENDEHNSVDPQ